MRHSAGAGEIEEIDCSPSTTTHASRQLLARLRRRLLKAILSDEQTDIVKSATHEISQTLGCPCSFIEGDVVEKAAPGCQMFDVQADNYRIGTMIVADRDDAIERFDAEALQEIADLLGMCAVQVQQSRIIDELQGESEDMLFHAPDAIFVTAMDGTVRIANRRALEYVGLRAEEAEGRGLADVLGWVAPDERVLGDLANQEEPIEVELSSPLGNRFASLTLSVVGEEDLDQLLCVVRDVTKERQAQLALRRSERSTLMGETVEYLLHEVNNPLAALLANVTQATRRSEKLSAGLRDFCSAGKAEYGDDPMRGLVDAANQLGTSLSGIMTAGARIRDTMQDLRSVRGSVSATGPEQVDVGFELGLAIGAAEQEARDTLEISREIGTLPKVKALPLHLAEAFGALLKNAVQAVHGIPAGGEVKVIAQTSEREVHVVIEDNGPGVPKEIRDLIFMPFFTTKPLGHAFGLGLTMADDAVRRAGGTIELNDDFEAGTRFLVKLPALYTNV